MLEDKGARSTCRQKCCSVRCWGLSAVAMLASRAPAADPVKVSLSAIGRPPIFSNTYVDVAETMGYWKAAGADVNVPLVPARLRYRQGGRDR